MSLLYTFYSTKGVSNLELRLIDRELVFFFPIMVGMIIFHPVVTTVSLLMEYDRLLRAAGDGTLNILEVLLVVATVRHALVCMLNHACF